MAEREPAATDACPKEALYKIEVDAMKAALDAIEEFDKALDKAGAYAAGRIEIHTSCGPAGHLIWDQDTDSWRFLPAQGESDV